MNCDKVSAQPEMGRKFSKVEGEFEGDHTRQRRSSGEREDSSADDGPVLDMVACLLPTPLTMSVAFTSFGTGFDGSLSHRSSAFNNPASWLHVPVPHLPRSMAYSAQLPMKRIPGTVVRCAVMLCCYVGKGHSSSASSSVGNDPGPYGSPSVDHDRDASFFMSDSTPGSPNTSASISVNRFVVFSTSELNVGELRLYDIVTHHLCAIIRLQYITKVL